jgi:iron complex transport system substrate-binding protein
MKRIRLYVFIFPLILLTACASSVTQAPAMPGPQPLILTDDLGRTIELSGPAKAVVTLGPSALEGLFSIGAGDQVVGREEYSTYPEAALAITNIGSLFGELPAEAIISLEPDLVIAPEIISREQVQALEDLGLTVYWQANPQDFPSLYKNLRALAELSGRQVEAEALILSLEARVKVVAETITTAETRPTVFYELDATDPDNPFTTGAGTFIDTIITMAGGQNIGSVLDGEYAQISAEEIILQDPEIIVLGDAPYGVTAETVAARAGWAGLQAVIAGRVYPFDPFLVSVPGPRLVDGLESMSHILHPELFD